jgi:glycosyltransferase involved in cell wall biosynthesis
MPTQRAIISTPEPKDGAAKYAAELAAAVAQSGIETILFCPRNFEFAAIAEAAGARVEAAPKREVSFASLPRRIWRNLVFLVRSARAQYRLTAPGDIVHFQNPLHFPLGFVYYLLAWAKGGRVVLTAHDPLPHRWRLTGALAGFERAMLKLAYRCADGLVVHNEAGMRVLREHFQVPKEKIRIIPHGPYQVASRKIDYPDFQPLRLLCFGAIRENKGLHLVIEAYGQVKDSLPVPVTLTIRGELHTAAESEYWQQCRKAIEANSEGIDVRLEFVPDAEVSELIERHHAVILPYTDFHSESGVAALAISHRRPLLATDAGGLGELLREFDCGIRIASPTVEGVAQAIRAAAHAGPEKLEAMGLHGEQGLRERRSWRSIGNRTAEFYRELTSKGNEAFLA